MTLFPFYTDITNQTFLIIGGGAVAKQKVKKLQAFTKRILVIAPETDLTDVPVLRRHFEEADLERGDYCIAATDDMALNARISALCQARGIPVNVVDAPQLCSFYFPSMIQRGDLLISISTGGKSPAYAKYLRQTIEAMLPTEIEAILDRMEHLRTIVPNKIAEQSQRALAYKIILQKLLETENRLSDAQILEMLQEVICDETTNSGNAGE